MRQEYREKKTKTLLYFLKRTNLTSKKNIDQIKQVQDIPLKK